MSRARDDIDAGLGEEGLDRAVVTRLNIIAFAAGDEQGWTGMGSAARAGRKRMMSSMVRSITATLGRQRNPRSSLAMFCIRKARTLIGDRGRDMAFDIAPGFRRPQGALSMACAWAAKLPGEGTGAMSTTKTVDQIPVFQGRRHGDLATHGMSDDIGLATRVERMKRAMSSAMAS